VSYLEEMYGSISRLAEHLFPQPYTGELVELCDAALARIHSQQAKIDELMLEYCPGEMTPEQVENYAKHQVVANDAVARAVTSTGKRLVREMQIQVEAAHK